MTNAHRINPTDSQPHNQAGVTELVMAGDQARQLALLLPMIAHLSNTDDQRWLTWIAPGNLPAAQLEAWGMDLRRVRLIHPRNPDEARWITWEALAAGNSHCVIASLGRLNERELKQIEEAAWRGDCQGLLLRSRADTW